MKPDLKNGFIITKKNPKGMLKKLWRKKKSDRIKF